MLEKDRGEMKMCHKLKPHFLSVKGNARQRVAPAKTLFSATTAKSIELLTGNKEAANFFELIDSFFDVMNSSTPDPARNKPLQAAFGLLPFYAKHCSRSAISLESTYCTK
ncbi:hypothetical protein JTE90_006736 [Oedothorax gibbosus]|uniref:Uncharacterized protein n=1 Tax=Oedothorax gibbosus TaxID=931172 RepID=A0AAV6UAU9_9ARAC|nr:hypothetical protein JTE90_006736 [Oedothorax gibbosus]